MVDGTVSASVNCLAVVVSINKDPTVDVIDWALGSVASLFETTFEIEVVLCEINWIGVVIVDLLNGIEFVIAGVE